MYTATGILSDTDELAIMSKLKTLSVGFRPSPTKRKTLLVVTGLLAGL